MARRMNRRQFLGGTLSAGAVLAGVYAGWSQAADDKSPNEKLNLACVGVANKGWHNIEQLKGQNLVALCDVDSEHLDRAAASFRKAEKYRDYRKLLDAEHKRIDAVVVSTADHTHAGPTALAITLGKHVYCEKPLAHTVAEARAVARLAAQHKVATQMGTQIHAGDNYRRVVELIRAGTIGEVKEVHCWCNKDWSNGRFVATDKPAPANLDWDLWLGPAKQRPFAPNIHPQNWRRFWEYGSGTFGDMACHVMDLPFWALDLRHPTSVSAEGPPVHPDGAPEWCMARYEHPAKGSRPALALTWSDGGRHPELVKNTNDPKGKPLSGWGLGVLFVGDKGMLAANYDAHHLMPRERFEGFTPPEASIPKSVGHWNEWVNACKTGSATTCNFDYSGALAEAVLLGVVAFRSGKTLKWDAEKMKTGVPEADAFVTKEYRKGWEVVGVS